MRLKTYLTGAAASLVLASTAVPAEAAYWRSNAVTARPAPGAVRTSFATWVTPYRGGVNLKGSVTTDHVKPANVFTFVRAASHCTTFTVHGLRVRGFSLSVTGRTGGGGVDVRTFSATRKAICDHAPIWSGNLVVPYVRTSYSIDIPNSWSTVLSSVTQSTDSHVLLFGQTGYRSVSTAGNYGI